MNDNDDNSNNDDNNNYCNDNIDNPDNNADKDNDDDNDEDNASDHDNKKRLHICSLVIFLKSNILAIICFPAKWTSDRHKCRCFCFSNWCTSYLPLLRW